MDAALFPRHEALFADRCLISWSQPAVWGRLTHLLVPLLTRRS